MKGLLILANGFEDSEALTTLDCLRRSGLALDMCSIFNEAKVTSSHNVSVLVDVMYKDIDLNDYDFLVVPGGPAVYNLLHESTEVTDIIKHFHAKDEYIFSICAAPSLLSKLGLFDNEKYTCFPGCDIKDAKGNNTGESVVVSGKFVSARSMYYSADFALAIIELLQGKDTRVRIENSIKGLN